VYRKPNPCLAEYVGLPSLRIEPLQNNALKRVDATVTESVVQAIRESGITVLVESSSPRSAMNFHEASMRNRGAVSLVILAVPQLRVVSFSKCRIV
jgi:hypothetical protein